MLFGLLFPEPTTEVEKKQVEMMSEQLSEQQPDGSIQQLQYNSGLPQIQLAFTGYHSKKQSFGDDDDDLIGAFVANLGEIDSSYLEPAVSGGYQQILSLTTDAFGRVQEVELGREKLSSPASIRKTPLDF